jgi:hypothetical protein
MIENDDLSFTQGRRNNDMVNWFVIVRIGEMTDGHPLRPERYYVDDFEEMMEDTLTNMQRKHLEAWSESWRVKLGRLHRHYGSYNINDLRHIWKPMDYTFIGTEGAQ